MEVRLKSTVLQLSNGSYIHYSRVQSYNKFGYQGLFVNNENGTLYQVQFYSKSVLHLNGLTEHLQEVIKLFKKIRRPKLAEIKDVIDKNDSIYVVSEGFQHSLADLIEKREGLT